VLPVIAARTSDAASFDTQVEKPREEKGGSGGGDFADQDAPIIGLFRTVPPPEVKWDSLNRQWPQTAAAIGSGLHGQSGGCAIKRARSIVRRAH
jgi:hypothetical protein